MPANLAESWSPAPTNPRRTRYRPERRGGWGAGPANAHRALGLCSPSSLSLGCQCFLGGSQRDRLGFLRRKRKFLRALERVTPTSKGTRLQQCHAVEGPPLPQPPPGRLAAPRGCVLPCLRTVLGALLFPRCDLGRGSRYAPCVWQVNFLTRPPGRPGLGRSYGAAWLAAPVLRRLPLSAAGDPVLLPGWP